MMCRWKSSAANCGIKKRKRPYKPARKKGSELPAILKLQSDFPENARALRNLAWAEQKAGNREQAVHFLKLYADMGMTLDPSGPIYKALSGVRSGAGASSSVLDSVPELKRNGQRSPQGAPSSR